MQSSNTPSSTDICYQIYLEEIETLEGKIVINDCLDFPLTSNNIILCELNAITDISAQTWTNFTNMYQLILGQ